MCVTTQYVGEAAYCDYVGLLSDGELLMSTRPTNLRRAAFDGEVVDVEMARAVEPAELAGARATCRACSARPRRCRPRTWRVVVDDADAAVEPRATEMERLAAAGRRGPRARRRLRRGVRARHRAAPRRAGDAPAAGPALVGGGGR